MSGESPFTTNTFPIDGSIAPSAEARALPVPAGALLHGETRSASQVRQQRVSVEGEDDNGVIVSGSSQRGENMVDDRQTANRVEWLGEGRTHPGACSGGQDYRLPRTHRPVRPPLPYRRRIKKAHP